MGSPIVQAWLRNHILSNRGASGCLTLIPRDKLSRMDVLNNAECIIPILRFLGTRPTVDSISQEVNLFFQMSRPRGKPAVKSNLASNISQAAYAKLVVTLR